MNRNHQRLLYFILILGTGIAITMISAAVAGTRPHPDAVARPGTRLEAASFHQTLSSAPAAQGVSKVGSTDGIMLMGIIIVLIVLAPILLNKSTWKK